MHTKNSNLSFLDSHGIYRLDYTLPNLTESWLSSSKIFSYIYYEERGTSSKFQYSTFRIDLLITTNNLSSESYGLVLFCKLMSIGKWCRLQTDSYFIKYCMIDICCSFWVLTRALLESLLELIKIQGVSQKS